MVVWPSFAALAVLAFIDPVLASPDEMVPGVHSRSSSMNTTARRLSPVKVMITPSPGVQLPPNTQRPTEKGMSLMVMPDDMDIDKMDIGNLRILNSISTMEEFIAVFGIEMRVAANDTGNRFEALSGSFGNEVKKLSMAKCEPELQIVMLNKSYIPRCVRLKRCGGCCFGDEFECRPTKTEVILVEVMRLTRSSGPKSRRVRPVGRGKNATNGRPHNGEAITVLEEQHIECDCQCRIREEDCNQTLQEYMPDHCKCQCRNREEEEKCTAQRMTHYWNDTLCKCLCLKTDNCTVSLLFNHDTCSCLEIPQNRLPNEESANDPRAGFEGDNYLDEGFYKFRPDRIPVTFGAHGRREGGATRAR